MSVGVVAVAVLGSAACSPALPSAPTPATAVVPTPAPAVAVASPSAAATERVDGTIQTFNNGTLTLTSGRALSVPASVRVTRSSAITAADLHSGDYVAVTGSRQRDNTLLATIVNVFPPSVGQVAPGQRPLPQGSLMTNVRIDLVDANGFTVTFPGGGARVQLAPDATITRQVDASLDDVHQGETVTAQVVAGAARTLTITVG